MVGNLILELHSVIALRLNPRLHPGGKTVWNAILAARAQPVRKSNNQVPRLATGIDQQCQSRKSGQCM
jgi:hypothetical protein